MQRHINTKGMGILNIPDEIKRAGGTLSMAVQAEGDGTSPGNWHSEFTVEEWDDFKKALNDSGMTITDVWIDESKNDRSGNMKKAIKLSRKPIKSSLDDAFTVYPWSKDCWKYSDRDLGLSYVVESYGEEFLNLDENTLESEKENLIRYFDDDAFVRDFNIMNPDEQIESIYDIMEPEDLSLEELARYFDYESFGRDLRLEYNMVWDNKRNCWFSAQNIDEFENEDDITFLGNSHRNPLKSSRKIISAKSQEELDSIVDYYMDKWLETKDEVTNDEIKQHRKHLEEYVKQMEQRSVNSSRKPVKSARFIVEDESGTVIGEADTYDEAKTLNGIIIDTQKDSIQSRRKPIKSDYGWEIDSSEAFTALDSFEAAYGTETTLNELAQAMGSDSLEENLNYIAEQFDLNDDIEDKDTWEKFDILKEILSEDELLESLAKAMGSYELADTLAFIFRQYDFNQEINSSRKSVKSSFEDDETIDVETIKEEWENEGYDPDVIEQFFDEEEVEDEITYSQERELHKKFEKYNLNITSSKKISNANFSTNIVKAVLSNRMTQEEAVTQIASRKECNRGYAKQILSRWINEKAENLIKSDAELQDIQKPFDVDGDLNSWAEDYMPGSGKANTKGGELVRAAQRILNEYYESGNMIGRGFGNETVNPAARYIIEKTDFSGNGEIEDMLNHDVQMDDSEYNSWLKRFESDFTDWLRDKEDLFSTPNDDDIADYIEEDDVEYFLKKFHAEDSFGNQYAFEDKDGEFECTEVILANENSYQEGDTFSESDDLASEVDRTEEYGTFEKDGVSYDWEANGSSDENGNYSSWKIVRATIENQPYEVGDLLDMDDFETLKFYDENGNEITYDDLMRV